MTSSQIKVAVKAMMDFAPAMMRCAEIVQSAEEAEARLAETATRQAAVDADLATRHQKCAECEQQVRKLDAQVAAKRQEVEREVTQLTRQTDGARAELATVTEAIRVAKESHQAILAKQQKEQTVEHEKLASLKRELRSVHDRIAV